MATTNFLYRSSKENANLVLRLLYRYNNKDYVLGAKTKIEVSKSYWKNDHKSNSRDISIKNQQTEIKNEINKLDRYVINAFNKASKDKIDKEWLNSIVFDYYNPVKDNKVDVPTDLINFIKFYIKRKKEDVESATITKYNVIKHKIMRLQTSRGKTILIKDINEDFKLEFQDYYKKEKYGQNTASRELDIIKTICYYAESVGVEVNPQLKRLKIKKVIVEKIYLNDNELHKIEKLKDLPVRLENARDWLVISCHLGQRVSDFLKFDKSIIKYGEDINGNQRPFIEFIQKKTKKLMTIPIFPKVEEYLNKRDGDFPYKISDQKYNEYIKEVCEIAGINEMIYGKKQLNISDNKSEKKIRGVYDKYPKYELVTSHIGRRSFATNYYYNNKPIRLLKFMTGHSTEEAFLNYIGKKNKDIAMDIFSYL
ncbi:MAG: phage integrase SAM-like domain-containing protein [Flavobacteriaceae bacterium]